LGAGGKTRESVEARQRRRQNTPLHSPSFGKPGSAKTGSQDRTRPRSSRSEGEMGGSAS
jgi:hypothetical protein